MHPIAGAAVAVVLLLPAIYVAMQSHHQQCVCTAAPQPTLPAAQPTASDPPAGRVQDPGVFAAQPGARALTVSGDVDVLRGTLNVEDGDILLNGRSLRNVLAAVVEQGQAACGGIPCVHGVHDFLRTCQCICETGWTGAACDTFGCFGHGTWNAALQRCDCDPPYERSTRCEYRLCRGVMATTCEPLLSTGCDVDGVFPADNCTERCGAPQSCAYRLNWGRSRAPTADYKVGLCGAAFSADGLFTSIAAMQCASNLNSTECSEIFEREAPLCCPFGADCGRPTCTSASCCAQRTSSTSCLAAGCVWASGRVCADPRIVQCGPLDDCEMPSHRNVTGAWSTNVVGCNATVCPITAVDRYAAAVRDICGGSCTTTLQLTLLRARLDHDAWPELVSGPLPSLVPFSVDVRFGNGTDTLQSLGACRTRRFQRLCVVPRTRALRFTFVPGTPAGLLTPWQEEHASGFLVARVDHHIACVAASGLSELLQVQLFDSDGVFLSPVSAAQPACGVYVLPLDGMFYDETGELALRVGADGVVVWGEESGEYLFHVIITS